MPSQLIAPMVLALLTACAPLLPAADAASRKPAGTSAHAWNFDGASEPGSWDGGKPVFEAGPRPPIHPDFPAGNQAASFSGKSALIVSGKAKEADGLKFDAGDSITIEAWVRVRSIGKGHMVYLVGKGRNGTKEFGEMNQNYALRLKGDSGAVSIGFLFTSRGADGKGPNWHRWWSSEGFDPGAGWHHVALSYSFGKSGSLRGFVDGREVRGTWDLGGDTDRAPVVDEDDLVIGAGYKRGASQSLNGWLDGVRIHRQALAPETLLARYDFVPPPPPVKAADIPAGRVLVQLCEEGVPEGKTWPTLPPHATESYLENAFGFFEVPHKYISTGVRGDRSNPFLLRAAAVVTLPPGRHRLLLRGRGGARLQIDGKCILTTPFPQGDTGGHGLVSSQNDYLNLGPDFRFAPPGNREEWTWFEASGEPLLVILETVVGGVQGKKKFRPELGETVVAISPEGNESWQLLGPGKQHIPYTDKGWAAYHADRQERLDRINAKARQARRDEHAPYWNQRREAALAWLKQTPEIPVPKPPEGFPAHNSIDRFIGHRIARAAAEQKAATQGTVDYFRDVKPILEAKCYDCHQGAKAKGGLRLDLREAALEGGKSDGPAVISGQPGKSALIYRVTTDNEDDLMPPRGDRLTEAEIATLRQWMTEGANWPGFDIRNFELTALSGDLDFLRRVTLDTVGVVPSEQEIRELLEDPSPDRRAKAIDRLLDDPRWADHWMGYWQDLLAENPNIINPTLNNTGPFRWWIYESLLDDKPMDLFVTELLRMEGSERLGGPAGFEVASQNDAPMAAKGIVVSSAFLGVEMKCARCHDAPAHPWKQENLFQLAAMLKTEPIKVPKTSSVPLDRIHESGRKPLIEVTLKPGVPVEPAWPFPSFSNPETARELAEHPDNSRDRLAALITAPENERFAQVMANRVWQRFLGRGLVPTVADWEKEGATHPDLLRWLGREFVREGYRIKPIARLILNSHTYQRATDPALKAPSPLFIAPAPRRLSAEQIVDSLFAATGAPFEVEEVSLDIDSVRTLGNSISLGKPRRAWMLASTSNERDRPSLSLPRIQAVASVMEAFGWRGARQDPTSIRETEPNILQPAILGNGAMGVWLTRLSDQHEITELALDDQPLERLIDRLYLRLLTRKPSKEERSLYTRLLAPGYDSRRTEPPPPTGDNSPRVREKYVSWSNHLDGEATRLRQQQEAAARRGDPPTERLDPHWRTRLEDMLWAMLNAPEWVFTP